ncbi:uncharacterized protein LOC115995926 [Ipomoea triloba]|uniref:uncharacterized protein LOC115995926 n=1 Tax=Ipomoea triloba TaxID=35885 RepID=UPI00125E0F59|nr:uncharacterized protein LOC115995926 [Ipomoea triloba]
MVLSEAFQVVSIIHLLPLGWKDFKNYLKHKRKEMNLEDLMRLRIEEGNRKSDGKSPVIGGSKANVVEHAKIPRRLRRTSKSWVQRVALLRLSSMAPRKKNKSSEANVIGEGSQKEEAEISLSTMIIEVNLVGSNQSEWFIDTVATRHLCCNQEMFSTFETIEGEKLRKNQVSGLLLNKNGFKMVFELDKVVLSKLRMFVGKDYVTDGMFKLSLMSSEGPSTSKRTFDEAMDNDSGEFEKELELELRRRKRARVAKSFGPDFLMYLLEYDSRSKWVLKRKMKADGSNDKYKASLVIKGYKQREGLDYFDTYSPMTRINSIWMILTIVALQNLEVHEMDVKIAFLNGKLDEDIIF